MPEPSAEVILAAYRQLWHRHNALLNRVRNELVNQSQAEPLPSPKELEAGLLPPDGICQRCKTRPVVGDGRCGKCRYYDRTEIHREAAAEASSPGASAPAQRR